MMDICSLIVKLVRYLPCCEKRPIPDNRIIFVDNKIPATYHPQVIVKRPQKFPTNRVTSSKYTVYNFVPKNLYEQFHRLANIYFLVVAIIQLSIDSPVGPMTSILPLSFVVLCTAVKQGYEDWLRHKADKEVNSRPATVVRDDLVEQIMSKDIRVGDIVKVWANDNIPCDMVLLSSEDVQGQCYVTTANLDGETNLKRFSSVTRTAHLRTNGQFSSLSAVIECQQPTTNLYRFLGRIDIYNVEESAGDAEGGRESVLITPQHSVRAEDVTRQALSHENVLLRGSRLQNTPFIYGCAIYTGKQSKISLNSQYKQHKYSCVERKMNYFLLIFLTVLILYSMIWVILELRFYKQAHNSFTNMWYIPMHKAQQYWQSRSSDRTKYVIQMFLDFMILCNYIIPISMYVSIELQKFLGSLFFQWDVEMYDPVLNEPAKAMTSDLNEELGQVEYLFSDKTGTLTENKLQFHQCSVGGIIYDEIDGRLRARSTDCTTNDKQRIRELEDMWLAVALCNTVRVERKLPPPTASSSSSHQPVPHTHSLTMNGGGAYRVGGGARGQNGLITPGLGGARSPCSEGSEFSSCAAVDYDYQSSSPDEKALVEACARFGIIHHGAHFEQIRLTVDGTLRLFDHHHDLDFDARRRRMSVIVSDELGVRWLLCKGADTNMLERIKSGDVVTLEQHINEFAKLGLRTLVIARRRLTEEEFAQHDELLRNAKQALQDREQRLEEAYDLVERDLCLLGATAVEDQLQEGVPDTLKSLRQAGIKVWVLTGDKEETATNISFSAGHLTHEMKLLQLTNKQNSEDCTATLQNFLQLINDSRRAERRARAMGGPRGSGHALVIDGTSLALSLEHHIDLLRTVCMKCVTVLCCRLTPIQKAEVVIMVKTSRTRPTTAAVGDGANDVSMIQAAHVGFGIMGKEGRQAARSSDYAISRFRFLKRALLVHGHYFYIRISTLVQYFFYKNVAMITAHLYFTFFSGYSAQVLYDAYFLTLYNSVFTSIPVLLHGLLEQNARAEYLLANPRCYRLIRGNTRLSFFNFLKWCTLALWHSLVFFFGTYFTFGPGNSPFRTGKELGLFDYGAIIMTACVITVNLKMMLETYHFNPLVVGGFFVSVSGFFLISITYSSIVWRTLPGAMPLHGSLTNTYSSPLVWMLIILMVVVALLPDFVLRVIRDSFSQLYRRSAATEGASAMRRGVGGRRGGFLRNRHKKSASLQDMSTCSSQITPSVSFTRMSSMLTLSSSTTTIVNS